MVVTALLLTLLPTGAHAAATQAKKRAKGATVTATLASLPPIVQPGTSPAAPSNDATLVATFAPASPGQKVVLEKRVRNGWKVVATATEDAWGSAAFTPGSGTYRASSTAGGRTWTSGSVTRLLRTPAMSKASFTTSSVARARDAT